MKKFEASELIINSDGTAFHLHITPQQLADRVILVGDPGRVALVASNFDTIECEASNREFHTITGMYKGKRVSCVSTGIGCDNIDIVMNELDSLVNIDYDTRIEKSEHTTLSIVRIGTCGGLQPETPVGTFIASVKSIGFDGLLNYYADRDKVCDLAIEEAFVKHMSWSQKKGAPYVATADASLIDQIAGNDMQRGLTIACGGFYGPQGRQIRLKIQDPEQNEKVESFRYPSPEAKDGVFKVMNFEMESSALAGLSAMLGHRAMTCCMVLASRYAKEANPNIHYKINDLIKLVLDRI